MTTGIVAPELPTGSRVLHRRQRYVRATWTDARRPRVLSSLPPSVPSPARSQADRGRGTSVWTDRDQENQFCSTQRYIDRSFQPMGDTAPTYGQDPYRIPNLPGNAGTRFRFDTPAIPGIGTASAGLPAAKVYRPCPSTGPDQCSNMPPGLQAFDPPYPVVVVFHGFTASMQLHRWTTQVLAEAGYMAIAVNGTWPYPVSAPNSQTAANRSAILDWIN